MSEVKKYMSTRIFSTSPDKYAYEAVDEMYKNKVSALLVKEVGNMWRSSQKRIGCFWF